MVSAARLACDLTVFLQGRRLFDSRDADFRPLVPASIKFRAVAVIGLTRARCVAVKAEAHAWAVL